VIRKYSYLLLRTLFRYLTWRFGVVSATRMINFRGLSNTVYHWQFRS